MKKRNLLVTLLALVLILTACGNKNTGDAVATVDGVEVPQKTFDLYYKIKRDQAVSLAGEEYLNQPIDKLGRSAGEILRTMILDSVINQQVILNAASDVDLGDIDSLVEEELKNYKEAVGEDNYKKSLEEINFTEDEYKQLLRNNIIEEKYKEKMLEDIEVTDAEKEAYFNENKESFTQRSARHILVETKEEADKVKERLNNGEDFVDLAKELSKDTGSAANGGDLGYFSKGTMVQEFENFVFNNEVGAVSDPIESQFGYHIIEITGSQDTMADVDEEITNAIKNDKLAEEIDKMVNKAKINRIYDPKNEPPFIEEEMKAKEEANPTDKTEEKPAEGAETKPANEEKPAEEKAKP